MQIKKSLDTNLNLCSFEHSHYMQNNSEQSQVIFYYKNYLFFLFQFDRAFCFDFNRTRFQSGKHN